MSRRRSLGAFTCFLFFASLGFPVRAESGDGARRDVVKIGIFDLAPFMMKMKDGSAGGVASDFWREFVAPAMGVDVEVTGPYPIPRLEMMLENGEVDVIAYITKIPAREAKFLYPENELMNISSCIVVRRDSPLSQVDSQDDLFGMKIGFITNAYIPQFVRHERIELELITTTDFRLMNHLKLIAGRVDALLDINYISFLYDMNRRGYMPDIRVMPLSVEQVPIYSLFGPSPRGRDLRARYDAAVTRVPNGAFKEITERYVQEGR